MKKHILSPDEVKAVDKFIEDFYLINGDFGWDEIEEYEKVNGKIYDLTNHKAKVAEMYKGAEPNDPKKRSKERFRFTDKGIEVYQNDGYVNWLKFDKERKEAVNQSHKISLESLMVAKKYRSN